MLEREILEAALEGLLMQKERIEAQIAHVREKLGKAPEPEVAEVKKRRLRPEAAKRIADAQRARWEKYRKEKEQG